MGCTQLGYYYGVSVTESLILRGGHILNNNFEGTLSVSIIVLLIFNNLFCRLIIMSNVNVFNQCIEMLRG